MSWTNTGLKRGYRYQRQHMAQLTALATSASCFVPEELLVPEDLIYWDHDWVPMRSLIYDSLRFWRHTAEGCCWSHSLCNMQQHSTASDCQDDSSIVSNLFTIIVLRTQRGGQTDVA